MNPLSILVVLLTFVSIVGAIQSIRNTLHREKSGQYGEHIDWWFLASTFSVFVLIVVFVSVMIFTVEFNTFV